jgi:hypothetical protein
MGMVKILMHNSACLLVCHLPIYHLEQNHQEPVRQHFTSELLATGPIKMSRIRLLQLYQTHYYSRRLFLARR